MAESPSIRPAEAADLDRIVEIQHSDPSPEFVGFAGTVPAARRLGRALRVSDGVTNPDRPVVVLEVEECPVAFVEYSVGPSSSGELTAGLLFRVVAALGPRVVGLPRRLSARSSCQLSAPADTLYIAELHVHPDARGEGFGGQLLEWTEGMCMSLGLGRRSLITGMANPAIRLYERHGFQVQERALDDRYERVFGQPGRVLMTTATI